VKRLAGKPFVLLGINSDKDRKAIKAVTVKERITWRSWWDGGGIEGPIATKWQISNWPTLYVLDANGVVRYIESHGGTPNGAALDKIVDSLLKEFNANSEK
jgi:hypothetical protein